MQAGICWGVRNENRVLPQTPGIPSPKPRMGVGKGHGKDWAQNPLSRSLYPFLHADLMNVPRGDMGRCH